ncbi:MAG TPA: hypothetical protein VNN73_14835 [Blastocatellia bacterium]|nr:hypothetical protein [Blastocatellia bacterium]
MSFIQRMNLRCWVDKARANAVRVAEHPRGTRLVFLLELAGCTVAPLPNALILVGLVTAAPRKWLRFALAATVGSIVGAFALYMIGRLFFQSIGQPLIAYYGAEAQWASAGEWLNSGWGIAFVMFAAITTGLFRIASLSAGLMAMNLPLFLVALGASRCFRWTAECAAIKFVGGRIHGWPTHYFKYAAVGAALIGVAVFAIFTLS